MTIYCRALQTQIYKQRVERIKRILFCPLLVHILGVAGIDYRNRVAIDDVGIVPHPSVLALSVI